VTRRRSVEDLSADELRRLLVEKRRSERNLRLQSFRRTGRVLPIAPPSDPGLAHPGSRGTVDKPRKNWFDHVLLVIEIAALVGLGYLLFNGFSLLRNLNNEVTTSFIQPTLTPTAVIQAVVLPSGHTVPDAAGSVSFNESEIPEHLRPIMQSLAAMPLPTPGPQQAVRIQIPAIGVDAPVVQGDGWEQLKKGVGQHLGTPNPGENGNLVLSAHNDVFGQIFRQLDVLEIDDEVIIYSNQRAYVYRVNQTQIVEPTQVEVLANTKEPIVTLISCYPYMVDDQRIVVTAILETDS